MRVLICAATGIEARACLQGVRGTGHLFEVLRTGIGAEAATRRLARHLESARGRPDLIVSSGFAGSLSARLSVGGWALARELQEQGARAIRLEPHLEPVLAASRLSWLSARFLSVPEAVARGDHAAVPAVADVVDMESSALHEIARAEGIGFQALRMITDSPEQPLPRALGSWAMLRIMRGIAEAGAEPLALARFLARAAGFPRLLAEGWRSVAGVWRA